MSEDTWAVGEFNGEFIRQIFYQLGDGPNLLRLLGVERSRAWPVGANKPILQLENRAHLRQAYSLDLPPPMQDVIMANKGLDRGNWHPG